MSAWLSQQLSSAQESVLRRVCTQIEQDAFRRGRNSVVFPTLQETLQTLPEEFEEAVRTAPDAAATSQLRTATRAALESLRSLDDRRTLQRRAEEEAAEILRRREAEEANARARQRAEEARIRALEDSMRTQIEQVKAYQREFRSRAPDPRRKAEALALARQIRDALEGSTQWFDRMNAELDDEERAVRDAAERDAARAAYIGEYGADVARRAQEFRRANPRTRARAGSLERAIQSGASIYMGQAIPP